MARKGWEQLSAPYRARLARNGVTQSSYESGISLRTARGHAPKVGRRSERFDRLVRRAEKLHWQSRPGGGEYTATETIMAAIASGMSMAKIDRLITARIENTSQYRGVHHAGPGAFNWATRTQTQDRKIDALYWYHP